MRKQILGSALSAAALMLLANGTEAAPCTAGRYVGQSVGSRLGSKSSVEDSAALLMKRLSKRLAAKIARQRGYTFFCPGYWPRGLPSPTISAYYGTRHREGAGHRTAITISAEKRLRYKDVKGVSPSIIANRSRKFITIILDRPERIPDHLKLDIRRSAQEQSGRYPRSPGNQGRVLPIAIRGAQGAILRQSPGISLAWVRRGTYILIIAINVPEAEVLTIARSLRLVGSTHGFPGTRPLEWGGRHAVQPR